MFFTPLEGRVIVAVARHSGRKVTRGAILDEVYPDDEPESNTLRVMVCNIRRKLRQAAMPPTVGLGTRHSFDGYWSIGIEIADAIVVRLTKEQRGDLQELINTHPNETLADRVFEAIND